MVADLKPTMLFARQSVVRRYAVFVLLLLFAGPAVADAEWNIDSLLEDLALNTPQVSRFHETRYSSLLEEPLQLSGELEFRPPDILLRRVLQPFNEYYEIQGQQVVLQRDDGKSRRVELSRLPPLAALVSVFRAMFTGEADSWRDYFSMRLEGDRQDWLILLEPVEKRVRQEIKAIKIAGADRRVKSVLIVEQDGDRSLTIIESPVKAQQ